MVVSRIEPTSRGMTASWPSSGDGAGRAVQVVADDDPQQGRLADAVRTHQGHVVAVADAERDVVEQDVRRAGPIEVADLEGAHGGDGSARAGPQRKWPGGFEDGCRPSIGCDARRPGKRSSTLATQERCQSGRMGRPAKALSWFRDRGFKSHPLRSQFAVGGSWRSPGLGGNLRGR